MSGDGCGRHQDRLSQEHQLLAVNMATRGMCNVASAKTRYSFKQEALGAAKHSYFCAELWWLKLRTGGATRCAVGGRGWLSDVPRFLSAAHLSRTVTAMPR